MARRQLKCACCGSDAGRWEQCSNQDTGFGICVSCADWIQERPRSDLMDPIAFRLTYGVPGVHYQAKTHEMFGRSFTVLAVYPDTDEGTVGANKYMEKFPGASVLEVKDGQVILADKADHGRLAV